MSFEGKVRPPVLGDQRVDRSGFSRRSLQCSGAEVVYYERGEGEPLVYLHGGGTFHGMQFAEPWARSRRVILPYHPNFGESGDNPSIHAMHHYVLHYAEFFDRLGLTRFDLIGASFGGNLAAEIALYQKQCVRSLVLAAPAGLASAETPPADLSKVPPGEFFSLLVADLRVLLPFLPIGDDPEFAAARAREGQAVGRVVQGLMVNGLDLARWLPRLQDLPTLVLWGEQDRVLSVGQAALWHAALQGVVETYPGVGHLVFDESSQARARALAFLSASTGPACAGACPCS